MEKHTDYSYMLRGCFGAKRPASEPVEEPRKIRVNLQPHDRVLVSRHIKGEVLLHLGPQLDNVRISLEQAWDLLGALDSLLLGESLEPTWDDTVA
jgi:hypothetical protein